jgi:outer membrane protein assembly factor BamE (lipoprotein component of BamABCDE complex)
MRKIAIAAMLAGTVLLGGCGTIIRHFPSPGDTTDQVVAKMGHPTAVYPEGNGQQFEYATGPMGEYTWMAHMGPDGRLVKFEQVLTGEKFATIKIDHATKADVLRTIGHPAETSYLALRDWEVWSYRYLESDVWYSMMNVEFDRNGIVRRMENGPDPRYRDRDNRFF